MIGKSEIGLEAETHRALPGPSSKSQSRRVALVRLEDANQIGTCLTYLINEARVFTSSVWLGRIIGTFAIQPIRFSIRRSADSDGGLKTQPQRRWAMYVAMVIGWSPKVLKETPKETGESLAEQSLGRMAPSGKSGLLDR
jgi:hypothetical protein